MNRLVVWGGRENQDSLRWILRAYHENALKLGIESHWVPNEAPSVDYLTPGTTVISADVVGFHLPYMPEVNYVLHNFDNDNSALCQRLNADTPERLLRLQVWTNEASGADWGPCRRFDKAARTLFQPWGTDLLETEFLPPVYNPRDNDVLFVGAVWSDQHNGVELGNEREIEELKDAAGAHGLRFVHKTQVPQAYMVEATRMARLAPVIVGQWQQDTGYLPCRAFKTASYGVPVFTNSAPVNKLFAGDDWGPWVSTVVRYALNFNEADYTDLVLADQDVAALFTYRESLQAIERAFEELRG